MGNPVPISSDPIFNNRHKPMAQAGMVGPLGK